MLSFPGNQNRQQESGRKSKEKGRKKSTAHFRSS
uniref:Uncharacterized protein n=1 Tax=Rhizophora mucronata TaxID=61149 RepID=A0A2P2N528_RHIMU